MMFFTGIGSRETPDTICQTMTEFAFLLSGTYTLRTGNAKGADTAFVKGSNNHEVYCPNHNQVEKFKRTIVGANAIDSSSLELWEEAKKMAEHYHPAWSKLSPPAKDLITRNTFQVLGPSLNDPSKFLVCWTPDGAKHSTTAKTGGTGQAIRIANSYDIPVYNLANDGDLSTIHSWTMYDF